MLSIRCSALVAGVEVASTRTAISSVTDSSRHDVFVGSVPELSATSASNLAFFALRRCATTDEAPGSSYLMGIVRTQT